MKSVVENIKFVGTCAPGWLVICLMGIAGTVSAQTRIFDRYVAFTNSPIAVTVTVTNGGSNVWRGFFYSEQVPSALTVNTLNVTLGGQAVTNYTFEAGQDGDVLAGFTPHRWRLETPTNFTEANPIPPQAVVQIVYSVSSATPGLFSFEEFGWAAYTPVSTNASFKCSEAADLQTMSIRDSPWLIIFESSAGSGDFTLRGEVSPGRTYQFQVNGDLSGTNWTNFGDTQTATTSNVTVTNSAGTNAQGFFRILDVTPP